MIDGPRPIANYRCNTGEGPLWHEEEQALYWMDIPRGRLFRLDTKTGGHAMVREGAVLGATTIQTDGKLLLMGGPDCRVTTWHDGHESALLSQQRGQSRYNDALVDPRGRVYSGTMPLPGSKENPALLGKLFRLDPDGSIHVMDEGFGCANGMGLSQDRRTLYFVDSPSQNIYAYDYDEATGSLENRRVHVKTQGAEGSVPDGMTLDADGCIWNARWNGRGLDRYDPQGKHMLHVAFPTAKIISSVTFGGPGLETMYATAAGGDNPADNGPDAGALFELHIPGVRGLPEFRSRFLLG